MQKIIRFTLLAAFWLPITLFSAGYELIVPLKTGNSEFSLSSVEEKVLKSVFSITVPADIQNGDMLDITLQDMKIFSGRVVEVNSNVNQTQTLVAKQDNSNSTLILTCTANRYSGCLDLADKNIKYEIISSQNESGGYVFKQILPDNDLNDAHAVKYDKKFAKKALSAFKLEKGKRNETDSAVVDIMILYTPRAKAWADSAMGSIENVIAQSVARGNLALNNSNTLMKINLVHSCLVNYTENSPDIDLYHLTDIDGYFDDIHNLRDQHGADIVTLFERISGVGGMGWMPRDSAGVPELAFSVCRVQQVATGYTMIHEMGHNMGCNHRKDQDGGTEPGVFPYSAGWRWLGTDSNRYASVMSYTDAWNGQPVVRVGHFSNPDIMYQNTPTGHPADGDNARTLREMRFIVEDYRDNTGIVDWGLVSLKSAGLFQNYPNPFNPLTTIDYNLLQKCQVKVKIYNTAGSEVAVLINRTESAGFHSLKFDASRLVSGIYFYSLIADGKVVLTKKMVLAR